MAAIVSVAVNEKYRMPFRANIYSLNNEPWHTWAAASKPVAKGQFYDDNQRRFMLKCRAAEANTF
jgi:hypothetical protein